MKLSFVSIKAIALNTFKEAIRDRVLYSLLVFALLMIVSSVLLSDIAVGGRLKIIKDAGLASISIFGMLISVFIGIGLINKELERRTLYTVLTKPVSRSLFIFAKFLGLALVLLVEVLIMTAGLLALLFVMEGVVEWLLLKAVFLIYLELLVITAIAVFFSCFSSSPALSGIFCLGLYVIGHLSSDIKAFSEKAGGAFVKFAGSAIYYLLPNLENFNIKSEAVSGIYVGWQYLFLVSGYAFIYTAIVLIAAMIVFQRKDFT